MMRPTPLTMVLALAMAAALAAQQTPDFTGVWALSTAASDTGEAANELRVTLDNPNNYYVPGQRAYLRLQLDRKPLMWQWMRRFWQVIQTHSNSKWL